MSKGVLVSGQDSQFTLSLSCFHVSPLSPASSLLGSAPSPFCLWQSLGWASTSLGFLAGGALCLRGWRGPRVSFCRKTWETIHTHQKKKSKILYKIKLYSGLAKNLLSGSTKKKKIMRIQRKELQLPVATQCQHDMRIFLNLKLPTRPVLEQFDL